jgi:exosortase/archaeosortase family protein
MNRTLNASWVDRLPSWLWFALPALALLPVWRWSAARFMDGSDDPLGIIALAALAAMVVRDRNQFVHEPRLGWLIGSMILVALAALSAGTLPALARGIVAVLGVCGVLMALRHPTQPMVAFTGLALLALPILSSLQFFVGYPLRVVTAEASSVLLAAFGVDAVRSGSTLAIDGRLVMVDAACSGIHMAWVAYFTACVAGIWWRVPDRLFLRCIPIISITVLAGNVLRNTVLVAKESELLAWPDWTHAAAGLVVFIAVCAFILWQVFLAARESLWPRYLEPLPDPIEAAFLRRWARALAFVAFVALALTPLLRKETVATPTAVPSVEWPQHYEGRQLRPLALSVVEQRFAQEFPGAIGRFSDGEGVIVLRHIATPTRKLHPATDCYRGLGYTISALALERETVSTSPTPALWRCFIAAKDGQRVRVCEQIVDAAGQSFSDPSAWYWAAILGQSHGPWRTVTKAVAI